MERSITVKGQGRYSARPDIIILTLNLWAQDMRYEQAMTLAERQLEALRAAVLPLGFEKAELKTSDFSVDARYESLRDKDGNFQQQFAGYRVSHSLRLKFALDTALLARVLSAATESGSQPELHIAFGVKDEDAVTKALLADAAANARAKAEILAAASGASLGELLSIDYNWGEISLRSRTSYMMNNAADATLTAKCSMDVEPEDVEASDTATFVWALK